MKLIVKLEFTDQDTTDVTVAVTPEDLALPKAEFVALLADAVGVIQCPGL